MAQSTTTLQCDLTIFATLWFSASLIVDQRCLANCSVMPDSFKAPILLCWNIDCFSRRTLCKGEMSMPSTGIFFHPVPEVCLIVLFSDCKFRWHQKFIVCLLKGQIAVCFVAMTWMQPSFDISPENLALRFCSFQWDFLHAADVHFVRTTFVGHAPSKVCAFLLDVKLQAARTCNCMAFTLAVKFFAFDANLSPVLWHINLSQNLRQLQDDFTILQEILWVQV